MTARGMVDAARYPKVARYLSRLEGGLAAHPGCQVKGSVLKNALETAPIALETSGLPAEIAKLVESPPLTSEWMSEVRLNATMIAFADSMPDTEWQAWTYERNRALFRTSLYRVLFFVLSPERLFVGIANRWAAFRRGTSLRLLDLKNRRARLELSYPLNLYDESTLTAMRIAFRAAADAAGATESTSEVVESDGRRTIVDVSWT